MPSVIPYDTKIYFSRRKALIGMLINLALMALGVFLLLNAPRMFHNNNVVFTYAYPAFCFLFPILPLIKSWKAYINIKPQIIINNKGIQLNIVPKRYFSFADDEAKYYKWEEISNESVERRSIGRGQSNYVLTFNSPNGWVESSINNLDTNQSELNDLLVSYREQSGKMYR